MHARSESQALQWRFDALGRLGDAQAMGAHHCSAEEVRQRLEQRNDLSPGAVWWVFDWLSAERQYEHSGGRPRRPAARLGCARRRRTRPGGGRTRLHAPAKA
ncbi:MAG: hypothetical protein NFV71_10390 [Candidatus Accumulibacter sp.]|nr:hypothetical protein [Accumulibacter sp.]MCM8626595.1 hypothetical protein [Accumulibacter sp.]